MSQTDHIPDGVQVLRPDAPHPFAFSICTLMTRPDQYAGMVRSYRAAGFGSDCEYLCIDNTGGNVHDAYSGYNAFLVEARGEYIVLTHQDVELQFDDRAVLEDRLRQLDSVDPAWAACGNVGGMAFGQVAWRISDPHGDDRSTGTFPIRVFSLDENFIVVRRSANLCLSADLSGYHMYGPDLCVMADVQGHSCYVIDFHLRHLSGGTIDTSFRASAEAFIRKYRRAFRPRWIQTSVTDAFLAGSRLASAVTMSRLGRVAGIARRRR